jgi:hypothetical protein
MDFSIPGKPPFPPNPVIFVFFTLLTLTFKKFIDKQKE